MSERMEALDAGAWATRPRPGLVEGGGAPEPEREVPGPGSVGRLSGLARPGGARDSMRASARRYGVHPRTIRQWLLRANTEVVRVGSEALARREDVDRAARGAGRDPSRPTVRNRRLDRIVQALRLGGSGDPSGRVRLVQAAEALGYTRAEMATILAWSGHRVTEEASGRSDGQVFHYVLWIDAKAAHEAWTAFLSIRETTADAAERYAVNRRTIRRWLDALGIQPVRVGWTSVVESAEVDRAARAFGRDLSAPERRAEAAVRLGVSRDVLARACRLSSARPASRVARESREWDEMLRRYRARSRRVNRVFAPMPRHGADARIQSPEGGALSCSA